MMKQYPYDTQIIIDEIKERTNKLLQTGMTEQELQSIIFSQKKLSKLLITDEYKIILTDYNLEIKMYPLAKAVYLLYLKHPEGIAFKCLADYKNELLYIYKCISKRIRIDDMERSITGVTNPTYNTINEICSCIKAAFLKHLGNNTAQHYFITGKKGKKKKIALNENLIYWDTGL